MTLLKRGVKDVFTGDPNELEAAKEQLIRGAEAMRWKFDHTDYTELPEGSAVLHQSWGGNLAYAQFYAPEGFDMSLLSFVWPPKAGADVGGLIQSDCLVIPKAAKNPVLGHLMINHLLDERYGFDNYTYELFQPPLKILTPDRIREEGLVPENLLSIIIEPEDFELGTFPIEMPPRTEQMWQEIYREVSGGA